MGCPTFLSKLAFDRTSPHRFLRVVGPCRAAGSQFVWVFTVQNGAARHSWSFCIVNINKADPIVGQDFVLTLVEVIDGSPE